MSVTEVEDLSAGEVDARLTAAGITAAAAATHGVLAYRVVYRTIDPEGRPTTASQLVAVPKDAHHEGTGSERLRVVSWLHGTSVFRGDVASVKASSTDRAAALMFAGSGRTVSAPDYLGLGEGPGYHPYGHPGATVSASVDALRAARTIAQRHGRVLDRRVQVSGFSQGGPATMMLGRALQRGMDPYFRVGALAPIAGPFDLSGFEAGAAADEVANAPLYLAYFTTAWQKMYGLYDEPGEAFRAPYDQVVEGLFDGHHTPGQIAAALPRTSRELFTEAFLERMRNPSGELRQRLHVLDTTCDWRPEVPVHLYHASGDADVRYSNALHCERQLADHRAVRRLTDVGDVDHNGSVRKALPLVLAQFGDTG
ncbi:hypothetical protein [Streptomyces sp.]|uniref:hypothetical protein n=1 Tax=Streptomyces sp. TaxID=1931 RepID=UPI002D577FD4|nr:hypothetical protein [Streptomyces sp.]HZF87853.1 hypothetical protein [Streptomyces sp.]